MLPAAEGDVLVVRAADVEPVGSREEGVVSVGGGQAESQRLVRWES